MAGSADEDGALPSPRELPAGTVAVVVETSSPHGTITKPEFSHALEQAAAQANLEQTPIPGDDEYAELRETALNELVERAWLVGQAEEMGISVSRDDVADRFRTVKEENFEDEGAYRKFIDEARFTRADVDIRILMQILSDRIQKRLKPGQETRGRFVRAFNRRWRSRTVCAPDYVTERCSNAPRPAPLLPDAVPPE